MPPRRISFLPASCERFLIWSEASYEAGTGELGFVLFDPELDGSGFLYSGGLMPQDLHDLLFLNSNRSSNVRSLPPLRLAFDCFVCLECF